MKRIALGFASLVAALVFIAATSVIFSADLAAPQKPLAWRQQCRLNCNSNLNTCLINAHGDGPKKQECYITQKRCLNRCEPVRSAGD